MSEPQESLQEFYEWIEALPLDEADMAIRGIRAYEEDILREQDIRQGHVRFED